MGSDGIKCGGYRYNLLDKADVQRFAEVDRAGARDPDVEQAFTEPVLCLFEQIRESFLCVRHMTHIFSEDNIIVFIKHYKLDRSGTDIDSRTISIHVLFP